MRSTIKRKDVFNWDVLIEIFAIIALVWLWTMTYQFQHIGASLVPEDYDFFKTPNEYWASQMTYSVPVIATIFYIGLTFFNKKSEFDYYPVETNSEHVPKLTAINQRLWRWLKVNLIILFIIVEYFSFHTGSNAGTGIPTWFVIVIPLLLFGPIVYFFIEFSKIELE